MAMRERGAALREGGRTGSRHNDNTTMRSLLTPSSRDISSREKGLAYDNDYYYGFRCYC